MEKETKGIIFNIQRLALHDGPGLRTLVFLKGCPLRCLWCSNPESRASGPELAFKEGRCIGTMECGRCLNICNIGAIKVNDRTHKVRIDRSACQSIGRCASVCPSGALEILGRRISVKEVLKTVEEETIFHSRSGGGVTLSGGEPLLQRDFARALLEQSKKRGMDTALETCGAVDGKSIERVCEFADTIYYDIKCIDKVKHRAFTGHSNEGILANFERLCKKFPEKAIIVRTPVIPSVNDTEEEIMAILKFIKNNRNVIEYELLPYHRFGEPKYAYLGKEYSLARFKPPSKEQMKRLRSIVESELGKPGSAGKLPVKISQNNGPGIVTTKGQMQPLSP